MNEVSIIGLDLAKRIFQVHGARADGSVAFRQCPSSEHLAQIAAWISGVQAHQGIDARRRACGAASADVRWFVA